MGKKRREGKRPPGPDQKRTPLHYFQYGALLLLYGMVKFTPLSFSRAVGRMIGRAFHFLDARHRNIAMKNLDQAFGQTRSEEEKKKIVHGCFLHFGSAIMETLHLKTVTEKTFHQYAETENLEHFHEALAMGKGVILCSAHYGNWEVMNLALGFLKLPLSAMARPIDNPLVHQFLEDIRTAPGNQVIYKHKSVRKLLSALSDNRIIGIVNDQDVHDRNRIMVEFFGQSAATTPVPAALSYKTGAPIIPGYAEPLGGGRYLLKFGDLILPDPEADKNAEIMRMTGLLNRCLESQINQCPEPWMWMHQRFKTGEEGRTQYYKQPRDVQQQ